MKTPTNPRQDGAEGPALHKSADNASHSDSLYVVMDPVLYVRELGAIDQ